MRAVVVYESMFGNTHVIAERIAEGLRSRCEVDVVAVGDATPERVADADLLVVGGPTHVHGLTSATSRRSAHEVAEKEDDVELDPAADGPGLRDWLHDLGAAHGRRAAAFDTRIDAAAALTGRASKGIARRLSRHGHRLLVEPESFLVDKHNHLVDGEAARAVVWGTELASSLAPASVG